LDHENGDRAVEGRVVICRRSAEGEEILEEVSTPGKKSGGSGKAHFGCFRDRFAEYLYLDITEVGV